MIPLADGFEDSEGHFSSSCAGTCPPFWARATTDVHSGTYAMHAEDVATASDKSLFPLRDVLIPANATAATLTFWHRFDFEVTEDANFFDGAVMEWSDDNGATWFDVRTDITAGGYNGIIADIPSGNVLAGRPGWVGAIPDWQQVTVDVLSYRGASYTFRLRLGTDGSNLTTPSGWWVDDIELRYEVPLTSCTRRWSTAPPYPVAVDAPAVVGLNGALFVFGGEARSGEISNAYKYSTQSNEWTPIASLPEPRRGASAVTDGTYVYIVGGAIGDQAYPTLWRYDPSANNYVTLEPTLSSVAYHATAFLPGLFGQGAIFRIGGRLSGANPSYTDVMVVYSIASGSWSLRASSHPDANGRLAAVGLGGYVYTAGGSSEQDTSRKTYRYDPALNLWEDEQIADLPSASSATGALYHGAWLLSAIGSALGWDPASNRWRSYDQIPPPVGGIAGVAGDAFFVVGGVARMAPSDAVNQYVETDCASPTATATPLLVATPTPPTGAVCVGDCAGDRMVGVAELVKGVGIALGAQPLSECPSFDGDRSGSVAVNELVTAVNNALNGCG